MSFSAVISATQASVTENLPEIEFIASEEFEELEYTTSELSLVGQLVGTIATPEGSDHRGSLLGSLMAKSLPPLAADEERMLFRRMNYVCFQADSIRSTLSGKQRSPKKLARIEELGNEAEQITRRILESNMRLVVSIAKKYSGTSQDLQEFVSDGLLILLGAIRKFDYSRGFRFSTYATHSVQRHYFRAIKKNQRYSERFVLTGGEVMSEIVSSEETEVETEEDAAVAYRRLMASAKGLLTDREQSILHRRFGTGGLGVTQTLREVAHDLGISKERVRQIQLVAMDKLKGVAEELDLMPSVA